MSDPTPALCQSKGPLLVIPPEKSHSHWMPDAGGYTNIIVSPWDHPMLGYTMGTQRLEPGEVVPEHYHDRHEELFYIFEGSGVGTLDGKPFEFGPGYTLFFGRNISHTITNTGTGPLTWVWVFNPPGLEHVLSGVGTPRAHGAPRPAIVERPAQVDPVVRVVTKRGRPAFAAETPT
jgi:mannose-6-phosphate isomerase-like protein (cupin superfamily)